MEKRRVVEIKYDVRGLEPEEEVMFIMAVNWAITEFCEYIHVKQTFNGMEVK